MGANFDHIHQRIKRLISIEMKFFWRKAGTSFLTTTVMKNCWKKNQLTRD